MLAKRTMIAYSILLLSISIILTILINNPIIIYKSSAPSDKSVNILLNKAYNTFKIPKTGIIHIGARYANELPIYTEYNIQDILWIEADPNARKRLISKIANHVGSKVGFFAATNSNGTIGLHITSNGGHSSSIFALKNHLIMSPDILDTTVIKVPQRRLDDYIEDNKELQHIPYNVIVIDVQGAELLALQGATKTLEHVDAIIAEVNYDELYDGAVTINELDTFLKDQNFVRVDAISINRAYGDALYVKQKCCELNT